MSKTDKRDGFREGWEAAIEYVKVFVQDLPIVDREEALEEYLKHGQ